MQCFASWINKVFSKPEISKRDFKAAGWLIVGLGNPGVEYENTRHNLGFKLVDLLASEFDIQIKRGECRSLIGQTSFENRIIELVKPQTYMNLSGEAVRCLLKKDTRYLKKSVVVVDDLALPLGKIRLRGKGSEGGHNGLKSISACLNTRDYIRLRIGISPEHPVGNPKKFVLERFPKKDLGVVREVLRQSADAIRCLISKDLQKAMAQFN